MDIQYDENRGNARTPACLVSVAVAEDLYQATQDVFEWDDPADGDPNFKVLPIVRLERAVLTPVGVRLCVSDLEPHGRDAPW